LEGKRERTVDDRCGNMKILLELILVFIWVELGIRIERRWVLSRLYISPPLLAGTLGSIAIVGLTWMTDIPWSYETIVGRLLVTGFLFFVGFKIGMVYTLRHVRSLLLFSLLSVGLLFLFEIISWTLFRDRPMWLESLGAMSFAWNDEWMTFARQYDPDAPVVFHTSLLLVFLITPLVLRLLAGKVTEVRQTAVQHSLSSIWRTIGIVLVAAAALSAYWIKILWLAHVLFLFDFVLTMGMGIGAGLLFRGKREQRPLVFATQEVGKWSLYGFIVVMMITASHEVWQHGNGSITGLLTIKIVFLSMLALFLSRLFVRNRKHLIWASATWAFTISAPVSCMNAMRTVADKHGEAEDVILVVPPVILWMINYPHYWIFAWLYGTMK
jgi:Na+/glutamate symporter